MCWLLADSETVSLLSFLKTEGLILIVVQEARAAEAPTHLWWCPAPPSPSQADSALSSPDPAPPTGQLISHWGGGGGGVKFGKKGHKTAKFKGNPVGVAPTP